MFTVSKTSFQVQQNHTGVGNISGLKRLPPKNIASSVSTAVADTALNTAASSTASASTIVKQPPGLPQYYQQQPLPHNSSARIPDASIHSSVTEVSHQQLPNQMVKQSTASNKHSGVIAKSPPVCSSLPTSPKSAHFPPYTTKQAVTPVASVRKTQIVCYEDWIIPPISSDVDMDSSIDYVVNGGGDIWVPPDLVHSGIIMTADTALNKIIAEVGRGRHHVWSPFRKASRVQLTESHLKFEKSENEEDDEESEEEEVRVTIWRVHLCSSGNFVSPAIGGGSGSSLR